MTRGLPSSASPAKAGAQPTTERWPLLEDVDAELKAAQRMVVNRHQAMEEAERLAAHARGEWAESLDRLDRAEAAIAQTTLCKGPHF